MRALRTLGLGLLVVSCYAPDFENGTLQCGENNACPKGYTCATDLTCWKDGDLSPPVVNGSLSAFVGTWTFGAGTLNANCSDGSPTSTSIMGDMVPVRESSGGLTAEYFCGWHLQVAGSTATAAAGQSCMEMIPDDKTGVVYTYTWEVKEFTFTTSDGQSATIKGQVGGPFTASNGASGRCDGSFTGQLTKTGP